MPVYIIAQIDIHDREEYGKYQEGFLAIFARYKGELLVVSEEPVVVEGEWPFTRTVLIRFPSAEEARRWYGSPEYQALAQHRFRAAKANAVLVEGLPSP
ncbi:MAG: DUF1330 domain-containing protein [Candidatus Binatia bacterium]